MTDLTNLANDIQAVKSDLANAISLKGVPCSTNDAFNSYSDKVNSIQSGYFAGVNLANITTVPVSSYISLVSSQYVNGVARLNSLTQLGGSVSFENTAITGLECPNLVSNAAPYCYNCKNLTYVNCPSLIFTNTNMNFTNCYNLVNVNFNSASNLYMGYGFQNCYNLTEMNLPNLQFVQMNGAFMNCNSLVSFDAPNLTNITNASGAFTNCKNLTFVNMPKVTDLGYQAFGGTFNYCTNLTSFTLPNYMGGLAAGHFQSTFVNCSNLVNFEVGSQYSSIGDYEFYETFNNCSNFSNFTLNIFQYQTQQYAFYGCFKECTNFADTRFTEKCNYAASQCFNGCFRNCYALNGKSIYFNALDQGYSNAFDNMIYGVSNCTVHFPSAMQSTMSGWSSVLAGFGGTNTTVLFDL